MRITNKEEYKKIRISDLGLSNRTFNALKRVGFNTLYLLIENMDKLSEIRNMGTKSISEIKELLLQIQVDESQNRNNGVLKDNISIDTGETAGDAASSLLSEEILNRPATDLHVSDRICNSFHLEGIETIKQVLALNNAEIRHMKGLGSQSQKQLVEQIKKLGELGEAYFEFADDGIVQSEVGSQYSKRELDITTVKKLQNEYGLKSHWLCEWYGVSRQRINTKLSNRFNHGQWCGKKLLPKDCSTITEMINTEAFYMEKEGVKYYLVNNMTDDCAFLAVSETDIKCFFLADLPEVLQALLKHHNLHRFSENECAAISTLGKKVFILKKPFFKPNDLKVYRRLANVRGLSNEDYAKFLYGNGIHYCPTNISVTDERIIAFLRENTIDGRTFIPSTPDNQWIRSYISKSPYNTDEFIDFYGFSTKGAEETAILDFTAEDLSVVEKDMQSYDTKKNNIEKIFADFPLLGSAVLPPENLDILNKKSREFIGQLLNNSVVNPTITDKMQVALTVINYAKGWNTEDEFGFWKYITAQFGFRDKSGQLRNILCNCVKDALTKNQRWFVINSNGNQFKSSIIVHAFSTKRSWLHFCDFLFDFYKTNLNWEYIEDDPMITKMVLTLHNKMYDIDDASDEDIEISSKRYHFREGIIKLILYRPKYAIRLVSAMIKRIDSLVNHTAQTATYYEEQLCDEWMANKLQSISVAIRKVPFSERRTIAINYTRIKPIYQLHNETDIRIVFPDVRLTQNDFSSLKLTIYHDGDIIEQKALNYYGNELGKTMFGFTWNLEDYLRRSGSDKFDPQITITCDENEIYNSGKVLYRECLTFRNKTEVDISSCGQGGYSIFIPKKVFAEFVNAERSTIKENSYLKGYYAELQKDFVINLDGKLSAFDNAKNGEYIRIMVPENGFAADYVVNGIKYSIVTGREIIRVISSDMDANKKYHLLINSDFVDMDSLPCENSTDARVYKIEIGSYGVDEVSLCLMDLENNRMMLHRNFKIIPLFAYRFNRPYYYSTDDFKEARLRVISGKEPMKEYPVIQGDFRIAVPYQEGELDIPVPVITVVDNVNVKWNGTNLYWIKDVPQERFLYVKAFADLSVEITLEGKSIGTEGTNTFALGNAVYGYSNQSECNWLKVELLISLGNEEPRRYCIGKIATKEQFVEKPVLKIEDKKLTWDCGYSFIGDTAAALKLNICIDTEYETSFDLNLDQKLITDNLKLPLGEYKYTISKQSGNLFSLQYVTIATGNFFVGNVNELRFLKHIIQIDSITFEDDINYEAVKIRPCYIDHIEYKGIQYVDSENGEYPIYKGIMFFEKSGKRCEYSWKSGRDTKGNFLYPVNPVRIVYINDSTLCITNETDDPKDPGDGFYYFRYYDKYAKVNVYQITDREPRERVNSYTGKKEQPQNYFLADLYSYTRKGV